jgi:hypothetical protein
MPVCRITANARTAWPGTTRTALPLVKNPPRNGKAMKLNKLPRFTVMVILTLVLLVYLAKNHHELIETDMHKLSLHLLGALSGFWVDLLAFPYARPDGYLVAFDWRKCFKRADAADFAIAQGYELVFALSFLRRGLSMGIGALVLGMAL